ncbi:AI-2E family transporter [Peptoniphilus catoniae]|uniref:AI-2E family transporter n=1 Tax=Peptoniphilus catoniae TaxID=1660341 RepID=UPI0010FEB4EB|nr:AI-2E family transporter [Peptoniphilus catoniae]
MKEIMEKEENSNFYKKLLKISLISIAFYFALYYIDGVSKALSKLLAIMSPFIVGGAIAFILKIPMNFFENKVFSSIKSPKFKKFKRPLAVLLSLIILLLIISFLSALVIPQLIKSIITLKEKLPVFVKELANLMRRVPFLVKYADAIENLYSNLSVDAFLKSFEDFIFSKNSKLLSKGFNFTAYLANWITNSLLSLVFALYILFDKEKLARQSKKLLYALLSKEKANYALRAFSLAHDYFNAFVSGQILDGLVIGLMTFIGMIVMSMPNAAMISVVVAFSDLIPIIGPIIGAAIGVLFILIESPAKSLMFLIMMLIFQQIQGNIIYPKIMGDKLNLPSMWTLFSVIVGGSLMGIVGMWIFIPAFAVIYTLLSEYINKRLNQKKYQI